MNYWDHLHNGEGAYESLQVLFRQSTFPNLMDTHPPGVFQIDGNLGGANGMLEAVVQSVWFPDHADIDLLPALPAAWGAGELKGVRVRGGAELSMRWTDHKIVSSMLRATADKTFFIYPARGHRLRAVSAGTEKQTLYEENGAMAFKAKAGRLYELRFE